MKSAQSDVKHNKAAHHPRGQRAASTFQILLNYDCCKDTIKKRDYKTASPFSVVFISNIGFDGFDGFLFCQRIYFSCHQMNRMNQTAGAMCCFLPTDSTDNTNFLSPDEPDEPDGWRNVLFCQRITLITLIYFSVSFEPSVVYLSIWFIWLIW